MEGVGPLLLDCVIGMQPRPLSFILRRHALARLVGLSLCGACRLRRSSSRHCARRILTRSRKEIRCEEKRLAESSAKPAGDIQSRSAVCLARVGRNVTGTFVRARILSGPPGREFPIGSSVGLFGGRGSSRCFTNFLKAFLLYSLRSMHSDSCRFPLSPADFGFLTPPLSLRHGPASGVARGGTPISASSVTVLSLLLLPSSSLPHVSFTGPRAPGPASRCGS